MLPTRFRRWMFISGGIVLLILVFLTLVVPRLLPADLIRNEIVRQVEGATGARVTLGEAQLKWRGGWCVTLREGIIRGTGVDLATATGSANDLESYAIEIGEIRVEPALLPLIRKQLVVNSVQVAAPRLDVRRRNGGTEVAGFTVRITDLNLDVAEPGALSADNLSLAFTAFADSLALQGVPYTRVDMSGNYADQILEVTVLSAQRSGGTLRGTLALDFAKKPEGRLEFEAVAELVPADVLLAEWAPEIGQRLECRLNATVDGSFDLGDNETILGTLDISGILTGDQGVLHAADWLEDVSRYLGQRQDLKDVRFENLRHEFRMSQGRYLVDELDISGGDTDWRGSGWLVPDGAVAMEIDVKLPPGFTPDLGNWSFLARSLRDSEGRINLPLTLSGNAARPTVGVDLGRLNAR